jgi:hypothetical protein
MFFYWKIRKCDSSFVAMKLLNRFPELEKYYEDDDWTY